MTGHVAHRVGFHLARAEAAEEAHREGVGDQRAGAGVVRVHDLVGTVTASDCLEAFRDCPDGIVPGDRFEAALSLVACALERRQQPGVRVAEDAVVGERALSAERAPAHRVVRVAEHAGDRTVALDRNDAAGIVAIAWAGGL